MSPGGQACGGADISFLNRHRGEGKSELAGELDFSGLLKKR